MSTWSLRLAARKPLDGWEPVERTAALCRALWDDLRALYLQARHEQAVLEEETGDAALLAGLVAESRARARLDAAYQARREARQRARSREVAPGIEAEIEAAWSDMRATWEPLRLARRRLRARGSSLRDALEGLWRERDRRMGEIAAGARRRYQPLRSSTGSDVLRRFRAAAEAAAKHGGIPHASDLDVSIYVQVPGRSVGGEMVEMVVVEREGKRQRVPLREIASGEPILRRPKKRENVGGTITGTTWRAWWHEGRGIVGTAPHTIGKRRARLVLLPLDSAGTLARVPVFLGRGVEPDPDALIKGVRLVRRQRAAGSPSWSVIVSIEGPRLRPIARGAGTLYCGLNWRRMGDGAIRVLDGIDESGTRVQVCVPRETIASLDYAAALTAALDAQAQDHAAEYVAAHPEQREEVEATLARRDWRALAGRLPTSWSEGLPPESRHAALVSERRAVGSDPEKYAPGAARILGDRAGRREVNGLAKKARARRADLYRRAARSLAERYGRVVLAESDGQRLAMREDPQTGEPSELPLAARRGRQYAAPYELAQLVREAVERSGGEWAPAEARDYSHTCPICGSEMERRPAERGQLHLRCEAHGVWDRDHALAMALWRDDPGALPGVRERWLWHAEAGQRSRARIVRIDAELEGRLHGAQPPHSRLRYVSGVALADGAGSRVDPRR